MKSVFLFLFATCFSFFVELFFHFFYLFLPKSLASAKTWHIGSGQRERFIHAQGKPRSYRRPLPQQTCNRGSVHTKPRLKKGPTAHASVKQPTLVRVQIPQTIMLFFLVISHLHVPPTLTHRVEKSNSSAQRKTKKSKNKKN